MILAPAAPIRSFIPADDRFGKGDERATLPFNIQLFCVWVVIAMVAFVLIMGRIGASRFVVSIGKLHLFPGIAIFDIQLLNFDGVLVGVCRPLDLDGLSGVRRQNDGIGQKKQNVIGLFTFGQDPSGDTALHTLGGTFFMIRSFLLTITADKARGVDQFALDGDCSAFSRFMMVFVVGGCSHV